jgi:hypothetical protein
MIQADGRKTGLKNLIVGFLTLRTHLKKRTNSTSSMNQQVFVLQTSCVLCQVRKDAQLCGLCTCHSPNLRELRCDNLNYAIANGVNCNKLLTNDVTYVLWPSICDPPVNVLLILQKWYTRENVKEQANFCEPTVKSKGILVVCNYWLCFKVSQSTGNS